jgi:hypothetical protein
LKIEFYLTAKERAIMREMKRKEEKKEKAGNL